jgi:hypothetical protein
MQRCIAACNGRCPCLVGMPSHIFARCSPDPALRREIDLMDGTEAKPPRELAASTALDDSTWVAQDWVDMRGFHRDCYGVQERAQQYPVSQRQRTTGVSQPVGP